ncbi:MAG TPA: hypothetical protein VMW08_17110 [Acidimicrobiales bacterium]|nr:hypothetical protein [Acidimicrobiales bacterium]
MATIRERGDGVYEVRVFVGRDERGKPSQRSKTVRGGKREAERVAAELETKPFRAGAKTVADALDAWVEMKTPTWAVSSKRDQIGRANALKEDPIGNVSVARLGVEDVDKWIARRRKQGKGEGTIRNQLQVLRSALRQAERWGWIADNPATKAELKRPKRVERGVMSDDEVFAVLDAAAELHEMAPIALRLAAVTGARRSELAGLRWAAVDGAEIVFDRQIVIDREHPDAERGAPVIREDATKTGARRRVTVDARPPRCSPMPVSVGRNSPLGCSLTPTAHRTPTRSAGGGNGPVRPPKLIRRGDFTTCDTGQRLRRSPLATTCRPSPGASAMRTPPPRCGCTRTPSTAPTPPSPKTSARS